jgi:hypothetical protein
MKRLLGRTPQRRRQSSRIGDFTLGDVGEMGLLRLQRAGATLIVLGPQGRLVRRQADGSLVTYADLRPVSENIWNEIVVDGRGNVYVDGGPGVIAVVTSDGSVRQVADGIAFPNGMAITPDNRTLIIAESHGKRLTAFDIASDGSLSNGESGLLSATVCLTESALMLRTRFGMPTCPINVACAFGKAVRFCRPSISTADALHACSADTTRGHCSSSPPSGKGWKRFRRPCGPKRD